MIPDTQILLALAIVAFKDSNQLHAMKLLSQAATSPDSDEFVVGTLRSSILEEPNDTHEDELEQLASLSRSLTRQD
jgi:hypothetical protein